MKKNSTFKRLMAVAVLAVAGSLQGFAYNNVWVKAEAYPTGAGKVYVTPYNPLQPDDVGPYEPDFQDVSEFKRSADVAASTAFLDFQVTEGYQFAGMVRDNGDGVYGEEDQQVRRREEDGNFTAVYDPTEYNVNGSSSESMAAAQEALALMENVLTNAQVDSTAYTAYITNVAKAQADAKLEQRQCFSRLRAYGTFGPRNSQRDIITAAELAQTNPQDLVDILHNLPYYRHTVLYYGPRQQSDLSKLLDKEHSLSPQHDSNRAWISAPEGIEEYMEQPTPETEILLAPYDAKNIYMMAYNNEERPIF